MSRALLLAVVGLLALAPTAPAMTVSVQVAGPAGTILGPVDVVVPVAMVNRDGTAGHDCEPRSPIGALQAATSGDWAGTWDATRNGYRPTRIGAVDLAAPSTAPARHWAIYVDEFRQDAGCAATLDQGERVLFYVACDAPPSITTVGCWDTPLFVSGPSAAVPGPVTYAVREGDALSGGSTASAGAAVAVSRTNYAVTDDRFGKATLTLDAKGANAITVTKGKHLPTTATTCVSDGADGYCGTKVNLNSAPFIPSDYVTPCATTGNDGLCGTIDTLGPTTHVAAPIHARTYRRKHGPGLLKGTADLDPNGVQAVRFRLLRRATTTVRKRVRGTVRRVQRTTCRVWDPDTLLLEPVRRCALSKAPWTEADLDIETRAFEYHFNMTLPHGRYALEVQAQDRESNWETAMQPGRNHITYTVK